jgi:hypothetical protein
MVMTSSLASPPSTALEQAPTVAGPVRVLLRLEGLAAFLASIAAYAQSDASFAMFAALVLLPDAAFLGYLVNARVGAAAYNTTHSYIGPAILAGLSFAGVLSLGTLSYVLIWTAHIGVDRALGYGLKYPSAFGHTHLGWLGKQKQRLAS